MTHLAAYDHLLRLEDCPAELIKAWFVDAAETRSENHNAPSDLRPLWHAYDVAAKTCAVPVILDGAA